MTFPTNPAHQARRLTLFGTGAVAIIAALWLRHAHTVHHHIVTQALGPNCRALLEHAFSSLGLLSIMHMLLFVPTSSPTESTFFHVGRTSAMSRAMSWFIPGFVQSAARILVRSKWCRLSRTALFLVSGQCDRYCSEILSMSYLACALVWEYRQAFVSVYGGPPRGYFQYDQFIADTVGVVVAAFIVRRFATHNA